MIGMRDIWTALCFDSAVSLFGTWVEGKLNEYDPKTLKHIYTLSELLAERKQPKSIMEWAEAFQGMQGIKIKKA